MQLEMADTQQLAKQYREAANTYGQLLNEKTLPQREARRAQNATTGPTG